MSEIVICKDTPKQRVNQTLVGLCGWESVHCYKYKQHEGYIEAGLRSTHHAAKCPYCNRRSSRVHSTYERTLSDIPLHGLKVILKVEVSRYRCVNPKCLHKTFVGQCAGLTEWYQRRTPDQRKVLENTLGLVAATVGARQCASLGMPISPSTALRIIRGIENRIDYASYKHLCIDDFATRKGREYRTLIIDADSHIPLEIVPSREKEDVARALRKYTGATIISRDRSLAYAGAIKAARPRVKQVADKFHLVKNCGEHVSNQLKASMSQIQAEVEDVVSDKKTETSSWYGLYKPPTEHDIEMFNKVHELHRQGHSMTTIWRMLHLRDDTVKRHLSMDMPTGRKNTASKVVARYMDIIVSGVKNGKGYSAIWRDIKSSGGEVGLKALIKGMKKTFPEYRPKQGFGNNPLPLTDKQCEWAARGQLLTSKRMSIYVSNPDYGVDKETGECSKERLRAEELIQKSPTLQELREVYTSFRAVITGTSVENLDTWIEGHKNTKYSHIASFVNNLPDDIKAIKNAIRYRISNGPIEGCNNKVKAVKRSMYGRAKDDLLLIKIILYAQKNLHEI